MQLLDPRTGELVNRSPAAGFGRIPSRNASRLEKYPAQKVRTERVARNWLVPGGPTDQGGWPHCVAYAGNHLLVAHPKPKFAINPLDAYNLCQKLDYWPGEAYDGTSVDAFMQVLGRFRLIHEWRWARDVETLAAHVLKTGPAMMGTNWYEHMSNPALDDRITPTGADHGGHAYLIPHVNVEREEFTILNSWGNWARKGRAIISFQHMQQLLDRNGEAAIVTRWAE